jgi:hypothetical protein
MPQVGRQRRQARAWIAVGAVGVKQRVHSEAVALMWNST